MTTITLQVENGANMASIMRALGNIDGIRIMSKPKSKAYMETLEAIKEAESGELIRFGSFEEYLEAVAK